MVAITILANISTQAAADEPESCRPHSEILSQMAGSYGELPKSVGLTDAGNLIEVLSANDGSTWSIIVTTPDRMSCLVAAGEAWRDLKGTAADDANLLRR
jgi:hypothetical protein